MATSNTQGYVPELVINGRDVRDAATPGNIRDDWGVRMGDGFIDALTAPLTPKEQVHNSSRLEHGTRYVLENELHMAERELTLDFVLEGVDATDLRIKKNKLLAAVYAGVICVEMPQVGEDVYRLIYRGAGTEYGLNASRNFCHMVLKFVEPDPSDRDAVSVHGYR